MVLTIVMVLAALSLKRWSTIILVSLVCWVIGGPFLAATAAGGAVVFRRALHLRGRRLSARMSNADALLAVEATGLAVAAGMAFEHAATLAAKAVGGLVGSDIERSVRSLQASIPVRPTVPVIDEMFAVAAESRANGAPLAASITAVADDERRERSTRERRRLARLPVKLLFPLAFLILPGFLLLAVAPAVLSGIGRLTL
jgi:hypothetical protein